MIGGKRFVIQREISVLQFYPRKDSFLAFQLLRIFSKVSKDFFFFRENRQKVKCCPTPYSRRSETFE